MEPTGTLHLLSDAVLSGLPSTVHMLCVGSGTGAEILHFAQKFPQWRFTAVEPSSAMLEVFGTKAEEAGILTRCTLHAGYLDSLPTEVTFDAATALLVSQFILDRDLRSAFFRNIASRLGPQGILISSDLAGDLREMECQNLLEVWFQLMTGNGIDPEGVRKMREAYTRDVAVLPPQDVRDIIIHGGFPAPVRFFQAGMIHAWFAKRG